jgi:hypothetical protein
VQDSEEQSDSNRPPPTVGVPACAGEPAWITPELVDLTLRVWQPYYETQLSRDDAIAIIRSVGRLIGVLSRS